MTNTVAAFLLLLLVAISSGGRANRMQNECMIKCNEHKDSMFKLGQTYSYVHHGESDIQTVNGTYDSTGLLVKSKVTITAVSSCQMKLEMTEVEVLDKVSNEGNKFKTTPYAKEAKEILERNYVLFTRSGNKVPSICVNKDEPVWSQNMKKSIIDIIANNGENNGQSNTRIMKTRNGECLVTEENSEDKTKTLTYDLRFCESATVQTLFTDIAEAVVFDSSQVQCKYAYQPSSPPQIVHCTENYRTAPIRLYGNQLKITVTTRLERVNSKRADMSYSTDDLIRTDVTMSNDLNHVTNVNLQETKTTFKLLCDQHVSGKRSEIPKTFMSLVNLLKKLTTSDMQDIYTMALKTDLCPGQTDVIRSVFYDAIGFVNTPAATSVMVNLIRNKQISEIDQTVWFTSLSFMKSRPTLEMIKYLETLLQSEPIPNKQMYLGISAVTHLYCKDNYESCLMDATIRNIISFFLRNLGTDCSITKTNENLSNIQIALKSLGNLKLFNDDIVTILSNCVSTKSNPTAVRVSALEVMKHIGCGKHSPIAMYILQNNENDAELRINAYLSVMGCPDINTMFKVRDILVKEKANQVGSFIWTHLTNIQESNDLVKRDIKKLLNDVDLRNDFDLSKLKFSRNIEKTFSNDRFGMTFDSNIIFSEKSFIPRSLSLNTTVTILGRPTNFIEMSGRMEGFDDLLFKLLGPEGYVKKKDSANSAEDNMKLIKMLEAVDGNLNVKMFGQQISFVEIIRGSLSTARKYNIIEELLKFGDAQSMEFRKNMMLLDSVANLQTSLGFPLRFKVQGSVAVFLKIKSKLDVAGLVSWPVSLNVESHIIPSVMSEYSADVSIETPFSSYGMSMSLKSGSDTEFKALISANKNEEFSVKFDTPKSKQELITVSGKSFVVYRNKLVEQMTDKVETLELCSQESMVRILGVRLCAKAEFTDAKTRKTALLYGPFSSSVYIEKADTQTGYILRGLLKNVPFIAPNGITYHNRLIRFEFDTPQSRLYLRRFYFEAALDYQENMIKFQLDTPWNEVLVQGTFKNTDDEKKALFIVEMNKKKIVQLGMEHRSHLTKNVRSERGLISFRIKDLEPFETRWDFVGKKNEWMVRFDSKGFLKDKTYIKMDVKEVKSTRELALSNKYKISGSYETYFGKGHISGLANSNYYGHRWDLTVKHSSRENPKNIFMIKYSHKTEDKSSKSLLKYFLTSTISYGENAENFIKFKIENELSSRHIRTSIKTNYGKRDLNDLRSSGEIELQLYGGYAWKEDGVHYGEGSLTFKFPAKSISYEGRYNSEIGNRMFKLSLDLDENQKSKVNLKINYFQPKLYQKDTEFDVSLSLPGHSTSVIWSLSEVDVNKYKYSLHAKYNNQIVKVDGVQTEISKLKYDSSVKIVMPTVRYWPEKLNIDLRVDFVNVEDAKLSGRIEVPNSDLKYSLDLKLSAMPQNFLQLPSSEKNSVFRYTVAIENKNVLLKSESIFTCNPEEVQVYFTSSWNTMKSKDQQVSFDFHTFHKSPNHKHYTSTALISVKYPGNSHSIGFKSTFKYTELEAEIDLMWNRNQKISIRATYEIDNNWTEMGLKAGVTVKTPFSGLESTYLGINAIGQLRYRKVDIEFKWAGNKKILFDIIVQPRSSNDFTLTSKLVTPFTGFNLISFQAVHIVTVNSIKSEVLLELGPTRRYSIKFEAVNNGEGTKRDMKSNFEIESGVLPPIKVSFQHKDDRVHFKSQFAVIWMKTNSINIKNEFSYTFENYELITNGNLELFSTIDVIKDLKATWSMENRDSTFSNNVQFWYKSKNIFHNSIKGFFENEAGSFKVDFNGLMRIMSNEPYKVTNSFNRFPSGKIINNFSLTKDTLAVYSHNIFIENSKIVVKILVVNTDFKTIELMSVDSAEENVKTHQSFLKIGEKYLYKRSEKMTENGLINGKYDTDIVAEFFSDYTKEKTMKVVAKIRYFKNYLKIESVTTSESSVYSKLNVEISRTEELVTFLILLDSKANYPMRFELDYKNHNTAQSYLNQFKLNYNNVINLKSKVSVKDSLPDIDLFYKYKQFIRYFKFKYDRPRMGFEQLLETNLFQTTLKVMTSIEARGGVAFHTTLVCNLTFLKSIDIVGRFSTRDKQLDVIYKYSNREGEDEVVKISYSKKGLTHLFNVASDSLLSTTVRLHLNQFKKLYLEFKTLKKSSLPEIDVKFNYEGGYGSDKHVNELKVFLPNVKFHLENKLETVKWSYFLVESKLMTNLNRLSNYKIGIEYKKKPSTFEINWKAFCNERFVTFTTKLWMTSDWRSTIKVTTSYPILKEVIVDIKHKQNLLLTQVLHSCEFSLKSNERIFYLSNKVEWSDTNYIEIVSNIVAKTSQNNFFIKPKSFKFVHQFQKNLFNELLEIHASDTISFKGSFKQKEYGTMLNIDLQKMLKIDVSMDFSNQEKQTVQVYIGRNMERLINVEALVASSERKVLIVIKVEEKDSHSVGLEYELKLPSQQQVIFEVKSPRLSETVYARMSYDIVENEGSIKVKGVMKEVLLLSGKVSNNAIRSEIKYGDKLANVHFANIDKIFKLIVNIQATNRLNVDIKVSPRSTDFKFIFDENVVKLSSILGQEVELDYKIVNKIVSVKAKVVSTDPYKYEINGKTNNRDWSTFFGEVYFVDGARDSELTSRFSREDVDIYNIVLRKQSESIHFKYNSIFDVAKSGILTVKYIRQPNLFTFNLQAVTLNAKKVKVDVKIDKSSLEGKIITPIDWMRDVSIKGDLSQQDNKVEGSFLINYDKAKDPLRGRISYKVELTDWELSFETPMSKPFDKIAMSRRSEGAKVTMELRTTEDILLLGSLDFVEPNKPEFVLEVKTPKPFTDVRLSLNLLMSYETMPVTADVTVKSNLMQDFTIKMSIDPSKMNYQVIFSHPVNQGSLQVKVSAEKSSLRMEYNNKVASIELAHSMVSTYNFDGNVKIYSNIHTASPVTFEMSCKHIIDLPRLLSIDLRTKWNEKTVSLVLLDWKLVNSGHFDLNSKLILAPYAQEYKGTLDLSAKNSEEYLLTYSNLGAAKTSEITMKYVNKVGDIQINVKSPFELIRRVDLSIKTNYIDQSVKQIILLNSNYLGKLQMSNEYAVQPNSVYKMSSRIQTPYKYSNIYAELSIKDGSPIEMCSGKLELNKDWYTAMLTRNSRHFEAQFKSSHNPIEDVILIIEKDSNSYKLSLKVNKFETSADIGLSNTDVTVVIKSTTELAKRVSLTLSQSGTKEDRQFNIHLNKDDQNMKINVNLKENEWNGKFENSICSFLPKNLEGKVKYSGRPLNMALEVSKDSKKVFNLVITEKEFLFNAKNQDSEIKLHVTKSRFEVIVLDSRLYSLLVYKSSDNQVDVAMMINNTQYSSNLLFVNEDYSFKIKILVHKDSLDKLLEFYINVVKNQGALDVELNVLKKTILKLKFVHRISHNRQCTTEIRILYVTAVVDLEYLNENNLFDSKLSWNLKLDKDQLSLGSISTTLKRSRIRNFSINVNLQSGSYQLQLLDTESGKIHFILKTPYKGIDLDAKALVNVTPSKYEVALFVKNEILGEYIVEIDGLLTMDPKVRIRLLTSRPILKFEMKVKTSLANEYSVVSDVKLFDWEKIELLLKLETKENITLKMNLQTPFTLIRKVAIEKTLWINSIMDHKFKTVIEYRGVVNVRYSGNHEISYLRRVIKFNGNFETEDIKFVSVKMHGLKSDHGIDHVFLLDIKDTRYGYKVNGKLNPLFEGITEIYSPFHKSGILVLQGRQRNNGIKIQAGSNKDEVGSFEYTSNKDVSFMKISPPSQFGEPMSAKYRLRRNRRSVIDQFETEFKYGDRSFLEMNGKLKLNRKSKMVTMKVSSPMFSRKFAEMKLMHEFEDGTARFSHYLKVKDIVESIYKIVGEYFHKDVQNFKYSFNIDHPYSGSYHFSASNNAQDNAHHSNVVIKAGDKVMFMHSGKLVFEATKINGQIEIRIPKRHYKIDMSHSGQFDRFEQILQSFYNNEPFISYKANIDREKKSVVEIDLPIFNKKKVMLIFDKPERKVAINYASETKEYLVEIIDKNGQFKAQLQIDNAKVASFVLGYATKPLTLHWTYLNHYLKTQIIVGDNQIVIKAATNQVSFQTLHLRVTKNKVMCDVGFNDKTESLSLEYHFIPDNFFVVMETSSKRLSKVAMYLTPNEIKMNFNEYFYELRFMFSKNHVLVDVKNNFYYIKTVNINVALGKEMRKLRGTVMINDLTSSIEVKYTDDKVTMSLENNVLKPGSVVVELSKKIYNKSFVCSTSVTVDTVEIGKVVTQRSDQQYAFVLKTSYGTNVALSFDGVQNKLIIGLNHKDKYVNIIGNVQRMVNEAGRTYVLDTSVDSSSTYLQKASSQISYVVTTTDIYLSFTGRFNNHQMSTSSKLTNSKYSSKVTINNKVFSIDVTMPSNEELQCEIITPNDKVMITVTKNTDKYSLDIQHNGESIVKIDVQQNFDMTRSIKHTSLLVYRKQILWDLSLRSDFEVYEMKMSKPIQLAVIFKNQKVARGHMVGIWTKCNAMENGLSVTFNLAASSRLFEVSIENNAHLVTLSALQESDVSREVSAMLVKKENKKQWQLKVKTRLQELFEIEWASPEKKSRFKFNQLIKDGQRIFVNLEAFGQVKLQMKRDDKTKSLVGELIFFGTRFARIESSRGKFQAIINENGAENERIHVEWTKVTQGEWKKDYLSTTRLAIKQKSLNIDLDINQELRMETLIRSVATKGTYKTFYGSIATIDLTAFIDFSVPDTITVELKNPVVPFRTVLRRHQPDTSSLRYDMTTVFNVDDQISAFLEISVGSSLGVTSRVYYDRKNRKNFLQVHAKYLDDRQAEFRVFDENSGQTTNYCRLLLRLLNEHNVEWTFQYQSTVLEQAISKCLSVTDYVEDKVQEYATKQSPVVLQEFRNRYAQMGKQFPSFKSILQGMATFLGTVKSEVTSFNMEIWAMLINNEFYVDDITFYVRRTIYVTVDICVEVGNKVRALIRSIDLDPIFRAFFWIGCQVNTLTSNIAKMITNPIKRFVLNALDKCFSLLSRSLLNHVELMFNFVKDLCYSIRLKYDRLSALRNFVVFKHTYAAIIRMKEFLKENMGVITSGSLKFLYQDKQIAAMCNYAIDGLERLSKQVQYKLYDFLSLFDAVIYTLTGDMYGEKFQKMVADVSFYMIDQLKNEGNQNFVKQMIITSIENSFSNVNNKIKNIIKNIILPKVPKFEGFMEQSETRYVVTVTSPIPLNDIKSIPDFTYVERKINKLKEICNVIRKLMKEKVSSLRKMIDFLRWFPPQLPITLTQSYIPEFESYATILRSSLVTFDKKSLQLKPDACKVTLAKDMLFRKWEIVLEQSDTGRLYTLTMGKDTVSIQMDNGKVTLNGKRSELPLSMGQTKILSFGSVVKIKDDFVGLSITADPVNDMFTVGVSGWYHGKVRGLFGTADNEQFNDMLDDDNQILSTEEFLKVFSNGGKACKIKSDDIKNEIKENKNCPFLRKIVCKYLYKCPFSPMAQCFNTVNPSQYLKSCTTGSEELMMQMDNAVCQSARAYQTQCSAAGVTVNVPAPCRKCDIGVDKPMYINELRRVKSKEKVADIVFVIDEGKCLRNIGTQLESIISKVDENLKQKGITSVRFGVVTFRGDGMREAHSHTVNQALFGTKDDVLSTVKSLQSTDQSVADISGAVKLASKYPFRDHASKHIVLVACDTCRDASTNNNAYKDLSEILENNAIQFSVLINYNFQVKDGDSKKIIFGVDSAKIYTTMAWRGELVHVDVTRLVGDYCYELSMKRGGVVFNINYLTSKSHNDATQKRFIDAFATQVSLTAAPARTTVCKCYEDEQYSCVPLDTYGIFPIKKSN